MLFGIIASMTLAVSAGAASDDPVEVEGVAQTSNAARPPEAPTVSQVRGNSVIRWRGRTLVSDDRCGDFCGFELADGSPTQVGDTYFYLYGILSAGGGNACAGYDYHVVTIRGDKAWASDALGGCGEVSREEPTEAGLQVTFSPSAARGDEVCDVVFGRATCKTLPIVSQSVSTVTAEGVLSDGFGYTNHMPFVQRDDAAGFVIIDDNAACAIEPNFGKRVVATVRTTTFANGSTLGECLELRVVGDTLPAQRAAVPAPAARPPHITELVQEYLAVSGAREAAEVALPRMLDSMKAAMPAVPEQFWRDFMSEVDATELVELNIPSYEKRFSREELTAMIAFYRSPAGQKLARLLPDITNEVMAAGAEWGRVIGERVARKLAAAGYR